MKSIHVPILAAAMAVTFAGIAVAQNAAPAPQSAASDAASPSVASDGRAGGRAADDDREHREWHGKHHGRHARFFGRIDTDRDGQISRDELLAAQQRQLAMFERADTNHDGKVSREERQALRQALREEYRQRKQGAEPSRSSAPDRDEHRDS